MSNSSIWPTDRTYAKENIIESPNVQEKIMEFIVQNLELIMTSPQFFMTT